jgi:predicted Zn-dependent peptidase
MIRFHAAAFAAFFIVQGLAFAQDWKANANPPKLLDEPLARDKMGVTVHRLANGLTLYLSPNDQEPRITTRIAIRAGGAHDPEDSTGMAHYLEHVLFKGTSKLGTKNFEKEQVHLDEIRRLYEEHFEAKTDAERKAIYAKIDEANKKAGEYAIPNELDKAYKQLGISGVNAYTSTEQTVYVTDIPKNRLEAWAKVEGERFLNPVFRLFLPEIETVYEEKNRSLDNANRILFQAVSELTYKDHPYGRTILGSVEHLKNPSLKKMYAFYDKYYRPNNMAVALSGDFDRDEALRVAEKFFGVWEPKPLPPRRNAPTPVLKGVERAEVKYEAEEAAILGWRTVPRGHADEAALEVMSMVLSNSKAGLIDLRLNQAQQVKAAGSYSYLRNEGGSLSMWVLPKDGQTLEQAEGLLYETVDALKNGEFTQDDLDAIVLSFEIGEKAKLESNAARAGSMVDAFIHYEDWGYAVDSIKRLRAVTKDDVMRVAKKYLGDDRAVVYRRKDKPEIVSMKKPEFTKLSIDTSSESEFFKEIMAMPAAPISPKWVKKGRDYKTMRIPSGTFYYVKNPMNDLFQLTFHFERGMKHERRLCAAIGLWDLAGAGDMTAEALQRRLHAKGLDISAGCGYEGASASVTGLDEHFDEGLRLLRLRFEKPVFKKDDLAKMKEIWIGQHKDTKVDPGAIENALKEWVARGKKSRVLAELSDDEIRALDQDELVGLMNGFFDWKRRTSYIGTLPRKKVAKKVVRAGMKKKDFKKTPEYEPKSYSKASKTRIVFTHRDMVQSKVGMYLTDGVLDVKDYPHYNVYRSYMGGGMSSVVFQEVRESRALAYSAWGGYVPGGRKGDENRVFGVLGTQADKTIEATNLLKDLLFEFPPSEKRLGETRMSITERYRTQPVKFRSVPGTVMQWEDMGLKRDPRPRNMREVERYSLEELKSFASRWKDSAMTIYILGNKERVDLDALKKMGSFTIKPVDELFPY